MDRRNVFATICATIAAGGITAVIGAASIQAVSPYLHFLIYGGVTAIACGFIGLLLLFIVPPKPQEAPEPRVTDQRVTSYGQSGGITAHVVNTRPQPRTLEGPEGQALVAELKNLPKTDFWHLAFQLGDLESHQFASEIQVYMVREGFRVLPTICAQGMTGAPIIGYKIFPIGTTQISQDYWWLSIGLNPHQF